METAEEQTDELQDMETESTQNETRRERKTVGKITESQ
jgi:hypothetical protein